MPKVNKTGENTSTTGAVMVRVRAVRNAGIRRRDMRRKCAHRIVGVNAHLRIQR
jgi:hypothetical protein